MHILFALEWGSLPRYYIHLCQIKTNSFYSRQLGSSWNLDEFSREKASLWEDKLATNFTLLSHYHTTITLFYLCAGIVQPPLQWIASSSSNARQNAKKWRPQVGKHNFDVPATNLAEDSEKRKGKDQEDKKRIHHGTYVTLDSVDILFQQQSILLSID